MDYSLVKNELASLMQCSADELENYDGFVKSATDCISSKINDDDRMAEPAVIHLCATRAYVEIMLCTAEDDITSFKAGDVSFTKSTSSLQNARELYAMALEGCSAIIKNSSSFAFKVV